MGLFRESTGGDGAKVEERMEEIASRDPSPYFTSVTREKRVVLITNIFDDEFDGVGFDGVWLDAPKSHARMTVWGRIENIESIKNPTP